MKFNNWFATGYGSDSRWDEEISCELANEIERIDQANRRKRKALKQMTKAMEKRNACIEELEEHVKELEEEIEVLNYWIEDLL